MWPKEYGGAGLSAPEAKVLREEMGRINARPPLSSFGIWMLGPALLHFGTEGHDHWVVNGQKIWTSYADHADWIFCLVRTDKENKYGGITFMLFDMASEGVTTKPIKLISGSSPFCETFFDNVAVPKSYGDDVPAYVPKSYGEDVTAYVGTINRGWDGAKYLLGHEREMISGADGGERQAAIGAAMKRPTRWPMPRWARSSSTRSRSARRTPRSRT